MKLRLPLSLRRALFRVSLVSFAAAWSAAGAEELLQTYSVDDVRSNSCQWTGAAGDDIWSTPGNWKDGKAPAEDGSDSVYFPANPDMADRHVSLLKEQLTVTDFLVETVARPYTFEAGTFLSADEANEGKVYTTLTVKNDMYLLSHGLNSRAVYTFNVAVDIQRDLYIDGNAKAVFTFPVGKNENVSTFHVGGTIHLGYGVLEFGATGRQAGNKDYTVELTDDRAEIYIADNQSPTFTRIYSADASAPHSITFSGAARAASVTTLENIKDFSISGGNLSVDKATVSGTISGNLSVTGGSSLTIATDNLLAEGSGRIVVGSGSGAVWEIGSTTQTLRQGNNITLYNGHIRGGGDSAQNRAVLSVQDSLNINYLGTVNTIEKAQIRLADSTSLTFNGLRNGGRIYLVGQDIVGGTSASLQVTGAGTVAIGGAHKDFLGAVSVSGGSTLELVNADALYHASSVTLLSGGTLAQGTDESGNLPTHLTLSGSLNLQDGATLVFGALKGNDVVSAADAGIQLSWDAAVKNFSKSGTLNLVFTSPLENLATYTLISGASSSYEGDVVFSQPDMNVIVGGKTLASTEYTIGYDSATHSYYLTAEFGCVWAGGSTNVWSVADDGKNWRGKSNWVDGSSAVFVDTWEEPVETVTLEGTVNPAEGVAFGNDVTTFVLDGSKGGQFAAGTGLSMRGMGETWLSGLVNSASLGSLKATLGTLGLQNGTSIRYSGTVDVDKDARLAIESGSTLKTEDGKASLSVSEGVGVRAEYSNIRLEGKEMAGKDGAGSAANALVQGYSVSGVSFSGTGRLQDVTLGAGNAVASGASYTLAGLIVVNSTLKNSGTVSFDNVVFEVGELESTRSADGKTLSYTLISGGTVVDWQNLGAANFQFGGVSFSGLKGNYTPTFNMSTDGAVTMTLEGVAPVLWDAAWGVKPGEATTPSFAIMVASSAKNTANFAGTASYQYSNVVNEGGSNIVAVEVTGTAGSGYVLAGGAPESEWWGDDTVRDIWISDDGSGYTTKVGGLYRKSSSSRKLIGGTHLLIRGGSGETVYGGSFNVEQQGDTWLTLAGGTYDTAYGGSANAALTGNTHLYLSGATVTTIYGASDGGTLTGDALAELTSGSVTNVYGTAYNEAGAVSGNVDVYLAAGVLAANGTIDGDAPGFSDTKIVGGTRTLHLTTAGGVYDMQGNTVLDFDVYDLADGVTLKVDGAKFNYSRVDTAGSDGKVTTTITADNLTIKGKGVVELYGSTGYKAWVKQIDLQDQATLKWRSSQLALWTTYQDTTVTVHSGATLDVTGVPNPTVSGGHANIRVKLEGNGVDNRGALFKGLSTVGDSSAMIQLPHIELTNNALVNADDALYSISYGYGNSYLDLTGGVHFNNAATSEAARYDEHNYVLTKIGAGKLALVHTTVSGGTLNVLEGSVQASKESSALYTDVVLARSSLGTGSLVLLNGSVGAVNEFKIASLSGDGRVQLNQSGALTVHVNHLGYYGEFLDAETVYRNNNGYAFATYSGVISGGADASFAKAGAGVQYLTGSESVYGGKGLLPNTNFGGTYVATGRLYLLGTSTASSFEKGSVSVEKGVVGQGSIRWTGAEAGKYSGELYLGNGVRIFNDGYSYTTKSDDANHVYDMVIGVEASPHGDACSNYIVKLNGNVPTGGPYVQNADGSWSVVKTVNGRKYYLMEAHSLKQLSCDGLYGDGTEYRANTDIDRSKTLYVTQEDAAGATVQGWGRDGYRLATYSGVLSGVGALIKKGEGMLNIDQQNSYTGGTVVEAGTLNLLGWGQLGENSVQADGASIMLSYRGDGVPYATTGDSYTGEATEIANDMVLSGRGDVRWLRDKEVTDCRSAALISNVGQAVTFTLSGALSGAGNLLHCGAGTLVLTGNDSSFSLGSTVTKGGVHVRKSAGFGATAEGGDANVDAFAGTLLQFDVTEAGGDTLNILAADQTTAAGADGVTHAGNSLLGDVIVGSTDASGQVLTQMPAAGGRAWLVMEGNGYWAPKTQMAANGVLVFRGEGSRNIEAGSTRAGGSDGQGAGSLSGSGVVAVSDVDTTAEELETGTTAYFATLDGYSGDIVAEGALATFEVGAVQGNAYSGGNIAISGEGATVDLLKGTSVTIANGKKLSFTSTAGRGTYGDKDGAAVLIADSVSIAKGGTLSASRQQTEYHYSDYVLATDLEALTNAVSLSEADMLPVYRTEEYVHHTYGKDAAGYQEHFDAALAVNQTRVGDAQLTSLTLEGGSTYEVSEGNTSVHGGSLTLDATTEKIRLGLNSLENMEGKTQVVLFSDVESIRFKLNSSGQEVWAEALTGSETVNRIYAFSASDLFELYGSGVNLVGLNPTVVYDAGSKVVYLDYIPEPATSTLSLLALAALCARRRRK